MTDKQYQRHFTSIIRKVKKTKSMLKVLDIINNSGLKEQDKEDIYAVWWHLRKVELEIPKQLWGRFDHSLGIH